MAEISYAGMMKLLVVLVQIAKSVCNFRDLNQNRNQCINTKLGTNHNDKYKRQVVIPIMRNRAS